MATITEDYVSFETALLLKKKGFEQVGCEKQYNTEGYLCVGYCYGPVAPTLQMAMKWLREVHNLYIDIRININNSLYSFKIYSVGIGGARAFTEYRIKSYESACEEAIKYCLEKLI